jgi:hypothetical protein
VVVGHSNSGLVTQLYASTYPRQVAGLVLIDAVHPAYHKRQLALLKPLLPPEVWEALRQEAMTPLHRLRDPEGVDIWTSERQTRVALRRSPLRPMPLVVLTHGRFDPGRRAGRARRSSGCGNSCNASWPSWSQGQAGDRRRKRPRHSAGPARVGPGRHSRRRPGRAGWRPGAPLTKRPGRAYAIEERSPVYPLLNKQPATAAGLAPRGWMRLLGALLGCLLAAACTSPNGQESTVSSQQRPAVPRQRDYWPTAGWRTAAPGDQGMDPQVLGDLDTQVPQRYPQVRSLLVVRHGYLAYERYWHGATASHGDNVPSVTKSVVSALVGIALGEGKLKGLGQTS